MRTLTNDRFCVVVEKWQSVLRVTASATFLFVLSSPSFVLHLQHLFVVSADYSTFLLLLNLFINIRTFPLSFICPTKLQKLST